MRFVRSPILNFSRSPIRAEADAPNFEFAAPTVSFRDNFPRLFTLSDTFPPHPHPPNIDGQRATSSCYRKLLIPALLPGAVRDSCRQFQSTWYRSDTRAARYQSRLASARGAGKVPRRASYTKNTGILAYPRLRPVASDRGSRLDTIYSPPRTLRFSRVSSGLRPLEEDRPT